MQSLWSWGPQGHICSSCRRECLRRTSIGGGGGIGSLAGVGAVGGRTRRPRTESRGFHAVPARRVPATPSLLASSPARRPRRRTESGRMQAVQAISTTAHARYATNAAQTKDAGQSFEALLRDALHDDAPEDQGREQPERRQRQKQQKNQKKKTKRLRESKYTEDEPDTRTVHERKLDNAREDLLRIMNESIGANFNLPVNLYPVVSGSKYKVKRTKAEKAEKAEKAAQDDKDDMYEAGEDDDAPNPLGLRPDEIPKELRDYAHYARFKQNHAATPVSVPAPTLANTRTVVSRSRVIDALSSICVSHAQLRQHEDTADQREAYLSWLHNQFGLSRRWWLQRPKLTEGLDALGDALIEEEEAMQHTLLQGQREPQAAIHFSRMVDATNMLVDDLMAEAYRLWDPLDPEMQRKRMSHPDSAWNALRMLRIDGYPSYRLPDLDPEATTYARMAASAATRQIFANWLATLRFNTVNSLGRVIYNSIRNLSRVTSGKSGKTDIKTRNAEDIHGWVAKLCFNLIVSKSPPGIHNYHALIYGFTNLGLHTLSQIVADSLLLRTRFLPTQQTVALLLHQSRARGDVVGFYRTIRRIVALDSRGMKYRRRSVADARAAKLEYHAWARQSDINVIGGYVVQRTDVDEPLVNAILKGLLSLDQVRHATVVYAASLGDSAQIDPKLLHTFLNSVLDSVDIPAARALVQVLAGNASLITPLLVPDMAMTADRHVSTTSARKLAIKLRLLLSIAVAPEPPLQKWHHDSQMLVNYKAQKRIANPYMKQMQRRRKLLGKTAPQELREAYVEGVDVNEAQTEAQTETETTTEPTEAKSGMSWDEFQYRNRTGTFKTTFKSDDKEKAPLDDRPWKDEAERNRGAFRLTQALFVADTEHYLSRLDRILAPALAQISSTPTTFADSAESWTAQLANLAGALQRQEREQDQYRRMAQLKAVDQMAEAVFSACSHVMESFMETVTEDAAAIKAADIKRTVETGAAPVFQSILSCNVADAADDADKPKPSLLSSIHAFLQRASVPFAVRLATFNAVTGLTGQPAPKLKAAEQRAIAEQNGQKEDLDDHEGQMEQKQKEDKVATMLSKQVTMLERHLDEDTPIVSGLLEGRLKDILTHSLFPDYTSKSKLKDEGALENSTAKAQARAMPVEALVQARLYRLQSQAGEQEGEKQGKQPKQRGKQERWGWLL